MATFIGYATGITSGNLQSLSAGTLQAGDLVIGFSFRDGNNTAPTIPSSGVTGGAWQSISSSAGSNSNGSSIAYKYVTNGATDTTGSWTSATSVIFEVWRDVHPSSPIGNIAEGGGAVATITYPALTCAITDGSSAVAAYCGHRSPNVNIDAAVFTGTSYTNSSFVQDGADTAAGHRVIGVTSVSSTTQSPTGTTSGWRTRVIEIKAAPTGSVGSATGTGAASGTGRSTAASPGSSAGVGTVTATGASTAASPASSTGTGVASGVGVALFLGVGSSDGTSAVAATGISTAASSASSDGTGAASGVSTSTAASTAASSGTGAASAVGDYTDSSAWVLSVNFRSSEPFVTDGAGQTYCLDESYPVNRDGKTFGFIDGLAGDRVRDRDAGLDPQLAGAHFTNSTGSQDRVLEFQVDLPSPGSYKIRLALGDPNNARTNQTARIFDDTTLKETIFDASTASSRWIDATEVERDESDWLSNNAEITVAFSTTTFILKIGTTNAAGDSTFLAHLGIEKVVSTDTGDGESSGIATASGVGASTAASSASSAGTSTPTGIGSSTAASDGAAAGTAAIAGVGTADFSGTASAAGTGAASAVAISDASSVGSSSGTGAATGIAVSVAEAVASSAGTGAGAGIALSTAEALGNAAGTSSVASASASIAEAAASASGTSTVAGEGFATGQNVGEAGGQSTVTGIGTADALAIGATAGAATVTGAGDYTAGPDTAEATAAGTGTVSGVGVSEALAVGSSPAASSATGTGNAEFVAIASTSGASSVSGVGTADASGIGTVGGLSSVSAISSAIAEATAAAVGVAAVGAVGTQLALAEYPLKVFNSDRATYIVPDEREIIVSSSRRPFIIKASNPHY